MALRPKGEKRAEPAPEGKRVVHLVHPCWFARDDGPPKRYPSDTQLIVDEATAERWHAAGLAVVID